MSGVSAPDDKFCAYDELLGVKSVKHRGGQKREDERSQRNHRSCCGLLQIGFVGIGIV